MNYEEDDWMTVEDYEESILDEITVGDLPTESLDEVLKAQEEKLIKETIELDKKVENNPTIEKTDISTETRLPEFLHGWVKEATNVSHHNDIPAVMTGLVLIGQMVKQFVKIPIKASLVDSRIHFVWIQTSGTGKSELMNFVIPVSEQLWDKINAFEGYAPHDKIGKVRPAEIAKGNNEFHEEGKVISVAVTEEDPNELLQQFDNFDVVEYTDAALIGYQHPTITSVTDDDTGDSNLETTWTPVKGSLDGHGLARWDEFTNAGVFKQTQHKEGVVTYLNTLMNPIGGSSQIITKKLKEGPKVSCHSERSVLATTFPPKNLDQAITETGLFQRAVLYIWDVPEHIKDEIDDMVTDNFGVFEDINLPIDEYTKQLFEIYKLTKGRFQDVGDDPTKTMRYSKGFKDALHLRKMDLRRLVSEEEGMIRDTARTFMTRLLIMMGKISVLCCIADSKDITDKKKRFIVESKHANQAHRIIRNCYKSLIMWFIHSLKVRKSDLIKEGKGAVFLKAYNELKDKDGWVAKQELIDVFKKETKLGQVSAYSHFNKIEKHFEQRKEQKTVFLRLKGE